MNESANPPTQLNVSIAPDIFEQVPDYRRVILTGVASHPPDDVLLAERLAAANLSWRDHDQEIAALASVQRWRSAYRAVGLNPTKTRPAVEALIRRAQKAAVPPLGYPAVDAGTIVTLCCAVPVGVHVLDDIEADLVLAPATGEERFVSFRGELERPEPGEIVWRSGKQVLTRRWVHKQGTLGSVTERSRAFAVNIDLLEGDVMTTVTELASSQLDAAGIRLTEVVILDRLNSQATISIPAGEGPTVSIT